MSTARHISNILQANQELRSLFQRANLHGKLQSILQQCLPAAAAKHCHLGNFTADQLTLVVDNAHWATRLRYQQEQLLERLRQHQEFAGLHSLRLQVRPAQDLNQAPMPASKRQEISEQAREIISSCADIITDEKLRAAMQRLASNRTSN